LERKVKSMAEVQKQIEGLPLEELEGQEGGFLPDRIEMRRRRRRRRAGGGGAQFVTNTSESNSCAAALSTGCGADVDVAVDFAI